MMNERTYWTGAMISPAIIYYVITNVQGRRNLCIDSKFDCGIISILSGFIWPITLPIFVVEGCCDD